MFVIVVSRGFPTEKYPGNGIFEFDQAKALASVGHKVVYLSLDLRSIRRFRKFGKSNFIADGVEVYNYNFPVGRVNDKLLSFIGRKCFLSLYKKIVKKHGKPDLIHAHFYDVAGYVSEFCKQEKVPLVITEHSSTVNKKSLEKEKISKLKKIYGSANALIAVGTCLANNIKANVGFEPKIIHNIVDFKEFDIERNTCKDIKMFEFVSAGNLIEGKGFDVLIKSFAEFAKKYPNTHLTIMGGGVEETALKNLAKDLGLAEFITFYGKFQRKEFAQKLFNADAFVLASRGETFGVVYIEAMSVGVPVIATRCGGPEDFVNDSNGILVDVDDVVGLTNAMEYTCLNIGSYNSKEIKEKTLEKFSSRCIAEQLTNLYKNIV